MGKFIPLNENFPYYIGKVVFFSLINLKAKIIYINTGGFLRKAYFPSFQETLIICYRQSEWKKKKRIKKCFLHQRSRLLSYKLIKMVTYRTHKSIRGSSCFLLHNVIKEYCYTYTKTHRAIFYVEYGSWLGKMHVPIEKIKPSWYLKKQNKKYVKPFVNWKKKKTF